MSPRFADPRRKASLALAFIFAAGVLVGVAADRVWTGRLPASASATPLTADALADSLHLDAAERARVRQVVDSLDTAIVRAGAGGTESLQVTAACARLRLEEALPPNRRAAFRTWMQRHHARMMRMMEHSGMMRGMGGPSGRGMLGPGPGPGGGATIGPAGRGPRGGGSMMGGGAMGGMMQGTAGSQPLPVISADSLPERGSQGAQLVASYCGRCHGIPDPQMHRAAEWPGVVDRMLQNIRSSGSALPDSGETQAILAYLRAHARP